MVILTSTNFGYNYIQVIFFFLFFIIWEWAAHMISSMLSPDSVLRNNSLYLSDTQGAIYGAKELPLADCVQGKQYVHSHLYNSLSFFLIKYVNIAILHFV